MGHMSDDITNAPIDAVVRTASGRPMAANELEATATIEVVRQAGRRDGLREAAEYLDSIKCAHAAAVMRHRAESPAPRSPEPASRVDHVQDDGTPVWTFGPAPR